MSGLKVEEHFEYLKTSRDKAEKRYNIYETADHAVAETALLGTAPSKLTIDGRVYYLDDWNIVRIAESGWEGGAYYVRDTGRDVEEDPMAGISASTGGGTQHVTQSLETVASVARAGTAPPDYGGAIGVNESDGSVAGVGIGVGALRVTKTLPEVPAERVTTAYLKKLTVYSYTVNSDSFLGFEPGEVLFEGATLTRRSEKSWEIGYNFAMLPNAADIDVGGILVPQKRGWDYMWSRYVERKEENKTVAKRPAAVYVERVYPYKDLNELWP